MPKTPAPKTPRTVRIALVRGDLLTVIRGLRDASKSPHVNDLDAVEYARLENRLTEEFQTRFALLPETAKVPK